jgi:hypothetical protein
VPNYQGGLDGLCGPYAIVNALAHCGLADHSKQIFEIACRSLSPKRWPRILWEGTTFPDLKRMIRASLKSETNFLGITASYPFARAVPIDNRSYWRRFDAIFEDESVACVIIGRLEPSLHWIVAFRSGKRVSFVDSHPTKGVFSKNKTSIFAGVRRKKTAHWLVDRSELVAFHVPWK